MLLECNLTRKRFPALIFILYFMLFNVFLVCFYGDEERRKMKEEKKEQEWP